MSLLVQIAVLYEQMGCFILICEVILKILVFC